MAKVDEVRDLVRRRLGKYEVKKFTRVMFMGDGRGLATSNLVVPDNEAYVYVRESLDSSNYSVARMNRNVRPAFNIPVQVEVDSGGQARIVDVDDTFLDQQTSASTILGVAPHAPQHAFGGGDDIFIEDQQFKTGLVRPTSPESLSVDVYAFVYYQKGWKRFPNTTGVNLSSYIIPNEQRYVLVCVDVETNELTFVLGAPVNLITQQTWDSFFNAVDGFDAIPSPPGGVIPLAAILLSSDTTKITWDEIISMRMFLNAPAIDIYDRIEQLERYTGNPPSLAMMGAAETPVDENIPGFIDGGTF
jgi:hypothetical protein